MVDVKVQKQKVGTNSEMEENAVITFIPKVFYLGPKTRIRNKTEKA